LWRKIPFEVPPRRKVAGIGFCMCAVAETVNGLGRILVHQKLRRIVEETSICCICACGSVCEERVEERCWVSLGVSYSSCAKPARARSAPAQQSWRVLPSTIGISGSTLSVLSAPTHPHLFM
jgi:hypothetical protein